MERYLQRGKETAQMEELDNLMKEQVEKERAEEEVYQ